jgi:hypothetical protein
MSVSARTMQQFLFRLLNTRYAVREHNNGASLLIGKPCDFLSAPPDDLFAQISTFLGVEMQNTSPAINSA